MAKRMTACVVALWLTCGIAKAQEEGAVPPDNLPQAATLEPSQDSSADLEQAPRLVVEPTHVDLGVVRRGGTYDFSYVVTNAGELNLLIRRIGSTCGCTVTEPSEPQVIKPGEQLTIDASFDSSDRIGPQRKTIAIYSNDPQRPRTAVTFSAEVEALWQLKPGLSIIEFGDRRRGETLLAEKRMLRLLSGRKDADIEIVDVRFSKGGLSYTAEPIEERGYRGYRLSFTLLKDAAVGPYDNIVQIAVRGGGEEDVLSLPVTGQVIQDITVRPLYLFDVVPVMPGQTLPISRVTLRAIERGTPFEIRRIDTGPQLTHTLEEIRPGLEYRITVGVAKTAAKGPFAGHIVILTTNTEQPVITVPVFANIGSAVEVYPEIVSLRREGSDLSQAARQVSIRALQSEGWVIERVRSDNPYFAAALEPASDGATERKLLISLAESAQVGQYAATITVLTNIEGARELKIRVYGEIVE
ncbi:MAG: DUF1573 domain-containing protein [Planctomycetes bacterium]|nr:DUF1573 domain-containing protein [Planctomycetota bacterium]